MRIPLFRFDAAGRAAVLTTALLLVILPAAAGQETGVFSFTPDAAALKPAGTGGQLYTNGEVGDFFRVTSSGTFRITIRAKGVPEDGVWPRMGLMVDKLPWRRARVDSADWQNYTFDVHLTAAVHLVGAMLLNAPDSEEGARDLLIERITIAPVSGADPVEQVELGAWFAGAEAREQAVLAEANARIERHRTGPASVMVIDAAGNAVADAEVTATLTRHAFLFGANIMGWDQFPDSGRNRDYKQRFRELFNFATLPFYWKLYEPERGRPQYRITEPVTAWCKANDIVMKGHTLVWPHEAGIPPWAEEAKLPAESVLKARVEDILGRFAQDIRYWEIINEPVNEPGAPVAAAQRWAREAAPEAKLLINEYGILYEGHPAFYRYLEQAIADEVPFDAVGFQAHAPTHMAFPLDRVHALLDSYAELGKPIHITEFTPPVDGRSVQGATWRKRWDADTQAEYAADFYRLCFAHPAVEAISWWDFSDKGAWVPGGGLLDEMCLPKPAYRKLHDLIQGEWRTEATGVTGADGTFTFTGFHGDYTITARDPETGRTAETTARFSPDGADTVEVALVP
ncbi:MAG: endo-1,4-beta-xylanase [Candidatus Hydrogenedentota bacterium]